MSDHWVIITGFSTALLMSLLTGFYRLQWSMKDAVPITLIACSVAIFSGLVDDVIAELLELEQQFVTIPLILILMVGSLTLYKEMRV